jgi:hypothetical protein
VSSKRYVYACLLAVGLFLAITAFTVASTGKRGSLESKVEDYLSSILVADFQRSAAIGYVALQPSYPLENLATDVARLYMNSLYIGGALGNEMYTGVGVVTGKAPIGIQPAGTPITLGAGSIFTFCSPKGNRLVTGDVAYNLTFTVLLEPKEVKIAEILKQPNTPQTLATTTTYKHYGSLILILDKINFKGQGVESDRDTGTAIDLPSKSMVYYTLSTVTSSQGQKSRAEISLTRSRGIIALSYNISSPNGVIANFTIISQAYWNDVKAVSSKIKGMVKVNIAKVGVFQGNPLYHLKARISGSIGFSGFKLHINAVMEGDYVKLGSILYPIKSRLLDYKAVLEGPGKSCEVVLGGPAEVKAQLKIEHKPTR